MFGITVDVKRALFSVSKLCSKSRRLLKFNYEINFKGIKMSLLTSSPTLLVNYKSVEAMNCKFGDFLDSSENNLMQRVIVQESNLMLP